MSLLDSVKATASEEVEVAKKKNNNSEYQKRQREHQLKAACAIRDFLKEKKIELPADLKEEMAFLCREGRKAGSSTFGKPVIYQLFGDAPKKGASITALQVFEKTGKGYPEMRQLMRKWEKAGTPVNFDEAKKAYVLDAEIPAYNA